MRDVAAARFPRGENSRGRTAARLPRVEAAARGSGRRFARAWTSRFGRRRTARSWTSRSSARARTSSRAPPTRKTPTAPPRSRSRPPRCSSPRARTSACARSFACGTRATSPSSPCSTATIRRRPSRRAPARAWAASASTEEEPRCSRRSKPTRCCARNCSKWTPHHRQGRRAGQHAVPPAPHEAARVGGGGPSARRLGVSIDRQRRKQKVRRSRAGVRRDARCQPPRARERGGATSPLTSRRGSVVSADDKT